jgi:hypothetical protein
VQKHDGIFSNSKQERKQDEEEKTGYSAYESQFKQIDQK